MSAYPCCWIAENGLACRNGASIDTPNGYCGTHARQDKEVINAQICRKIEKYWKDKGIEVRARAVPRKVAIYREWINKKIPKKDGGMKQVGGWLEHNPPKFIDSIEITSDIVEKGLCGLPSRF